MQVEDTLRLNSYDTIALILDAAGGSLRGRTALQKLVYLSSVTIPAIEDQGFKAHYYGPYSAKLSMSLANMVSYSFLDEINVPGKMYGGYRYKLTDDGVQITKMVKKMHRNSYEKILKVVKTCKEFCNLESTPLSYASKIYYLLCSTQRNLTIREAQKCAQDLGWDIAEDDVRQGVDLLGQLKLV